MADRGLVAVWQGPDATYPSRPPFHPGEKYPEFGPDAPVDAGSNAAFEGVRRCFELAGLDIARFGTPDWNPLAELVPPGSTVLLKPNLVKETHPRDPDGWVYIDTHPSIIRAVADYVWLATGREGRVIIADAPQTDSSFHVLADISGLYEVRDHYLRLGYDIELVDMRKEEWVAKDGVVVERRNLAGDPRGYLAFDLGDRSEFAGHAGEGRYYGADYDRDEVNRHHSGGRHEYLVSATPIEADVVFSMPKLKTHKKVGITVSLKNLVGMNGDKNWLPHYTEAGKGHEGDERPERDASAKLERSALQRLQKLAITVPGVGPLALRAAKAVGKRVFGDTEEQVRSGNWHGNDTTWRMCLDLNKILLYGRVGPDGPYLAEEPKPYYSVVDGIVAGEGNGPMNPDPVAAGIVMFGADPVAVDAAAAHVMGFAPDRINLVREAFRCTYLPITELSMREVTLASNVQHWNAPLHEAGRTSRPFRPHFGWIGAIEQDVHSS